VQAGFFDLFIDDFFGAVATTPGQLTVRAVPIIEAALGVPDERTGEIRALAWRFAVPEAYSPGNAVVLRLFFYRTGPVAAGNCLLLQVDARRLRSGSDIETYGGSRAVRLDFDPAAVAPGAGLYWVVDLPINTPGGLDYPADLAAGQLLAFELNTLAHDDGLYLLLGVEIFETTSPASDGATVFANVADAACP
jgi:hypothetical protein